MGAGRVMSFVALLCMGVSLTSVIAGFLLYPFVIGVAGKRWVVESGFESLPFKISCEASKFY